MTNSVPRRMEKKQNNFSLGIVPNPNIKNS